MIKTILAATLMSVALASSASAATMKPMHHMAMKHKCHKGMMMMHGKCMADPHMKKMMKHN